MKFIITLQKQIRGSFYFAQVKKKFFPQRDKGSDGGGRLYRSENQEAQRFSRRRGPAVLHKDHCQTMKAEGWDSLSHGGWEGVSVHFLFFTKGAAKRALRKENH